ncbi:MAG: hypothetical protein JOY52_08645 [Hyphomicrobiales bacterium]|nr:hypothetical protein [Hyphomicrobiales bacterium]
MRNMLTGLLLAGMTCAFAVTAPAVAQEASGPSHHKKHVYANAAAPAVYQTSSGGVGAFGPLNALGGAPNGGSCGIDKDYMGRQTALCGL